MTVDYRTGDLFEQSLPALAHGVNCAAVMGAGIAHEFRRRWPAMFDIYRERCRAGMVRLGGVLPWRAPDGLMIYNMATQRRPAPPASLDAIRSSLTATLTDAWQRGVPTLGLPRVGTGHGGLAWADVAKVIEEAAAFSPVRVVVVSLPLTAGDDLAG